MSGFPPRKRVLDFHFMPVLYASPQRLRTLVPKSFSKSLQASSVGRRFLSYELCKSVHLKAESAWVTDWKEKHWHLALLNRREWEEVTFYIGLFLHWRVFAQVVIGEKRREIESRIGRRAYVHMMRCGPFLPTAPVSAMQHTEKTPRECLQSIGGENLLALLDDAPEGVRKRIILRLTTDFQTIVFSNSEQKEAWRHVALRLASEVAPQWARSCN